jgi:hypothetical protein
MVTDARIDAPWPVIALDPVDAQGTHVGAVADLVERRFLGGPRGN